MGSTLSGNLSDNGYSYDKVRSIGIGAFANAAPLTTRARLHLRNDLMYDPTHPLFNGKLFRMDGNSSVDNTWEMWTGSGTTASGYSEIFRLSVPTALPNTFLLQSSTTTGDIRFNTGGSNFRAIITSGGAVGINTLTPGNQLEINSTALTAIPGKSGLRFHDLTSFSTPVPNPGPGILSVDKSGDVIYVPVSTLSAPVCAQNGLNTTIGNPCVELGGILLHHTDINFNNFNMSWYNSGEHAITDYVTGPNSTAYPLNNLTGDYKSGIFTNTYDNGLRIDNIRPTPISGVISGASITVDADNANQNYGEAITVNGNGLVNYGLALNVTPRTPNGTALSNAIGVNSYASDAFHTRGGVFSATTTANADDAIGVVGFGGGAGNKSYGGLFYGYGSPRSIGAYGIAYDPNKIGGYAPNERIGVWGLSNDVNNIGSGSFNFGVNVGVIGITENDTTNPTSRAVGVFGVCGSNSWGTNYIPFGLRAGVYGHIGTGNWSGYFDGDVNINWAGGTGGGGAYALIINGSAWNSANIWTGSDRRYKENIKPLKDVKEKLKKLSGYTYNFKTTEFKKENFPSTEQIGLIAQELKEVFPQLVNEDKNGYLAVNYQGLVPVLIEGMKEQQTQIEKQQQQIDELKEMVKSSTNNGDTKLSNSNSVILSDKNSIVLNQNVPNPFAESTTITYNIPSDFNKAQLIFSTNEGTIIKVVDIRQKGEGTLNVFANDLSSGLYSYSLVVDGKTIDTKKMVKN
jgi:hypothetical protein